ncbi:MAG TPA: invasion associated locus B family protein [Pseudorhodoplanes sp.]|nr:invasion associated locus B family protein [Pseudorhodoplanes sp.]
MRPVGIFAALSVLAPFHASLAATQSAHDNAFVYYTDWVKTCPLADGKHVCVTRREARRQDGTFRVAIQLTEWPSKSIFYLGFPLGMRLMPGARLIVDQNEPVTARYANCDIRAVWRGMKSTAILCAR